LGDHNLAGFDHFAWDVFGCYNLPGMVVVSFLFERNNLELTLQRYYSHTVTVTRTVINTVYVTVYETVHKTCTLVSDTEWLCWDP